MSKKTSGNLIVGLDIGTSKVVAIVGEVTVEGDIDIIGIGTQPSRGLKKGVVVNIESTVQSIQRAVEEALLAIERAQKATPKPDIHHRLEHNALITQEQLATAKKLGVTVGFFVDHVYYYGDALPDLMGEQRMKRYMPLRTALEEGLAITLHGDHPATPIGPFRTLQTAVGRLSESGRTISGPDQTISRLEALKALTINAAEQLGEADKIGSIKIGKRADLTLLSDNPLKIETQNLTDIAVVDVWKNGRHADRRFWSPRHLELVWNIIKEKLAGL